jgi:hypothetical protein
LMEGINATNKANLISFMLNCLNDYSYYKQSTISGLDTCGYMY